MKGAKMDLESAIKHAEEVAENKKAESEKAEIQGCDRYATKCDKCASEHRQLAEWLKDYKRLKEQEPCEDAISRQAVLDIISELNAISFYEAQEDSKECYYEIRQAIKDLSPVKLQEETGHWITHEEQFNALGIAVKGGVKCSECDYTTHNKLHMEIGCPFKFCPNCGAKMVDEQEGSEE